MDYIRYLRKNNIPCVWSTIGRVYNSITNTTGVQSLLFELWPCVCASVGRVAMMAADCVLEIIDYLTACRAKRKRSCLWVV